MITIDALTLRYGSLTALDGVTMHLAECAVHGITGAAGTGKSSLLDAVYGLVAPDGGIVSRAGHPLRRRDMAYLEGRDILYGGLTGRDLLDMTARYRPGYDPAPLVRLFGLPLGQRVDTWTPERRRKLALCIVLMQRKPLLLLDEPFRGLGIEEALAVQELLRSRKSEGATILLTSREFAPLEALCDDIRRLEGGRLTAEYRRGEYARAAEAARQAEELEELLRRSGLTHFDNGKIN